MKQVKAALVNQSQTSQHTHGNWRGSPLTSIVLDEGRGSRDIVLSESEQISWLLNYLVVLKQWTAHKFYTHKMSPHHMPSIRR